MDTRIERCQAGHQLLLLLLFVVVASKRSAVACVRLDVARAEAEALFAWTGVIQESRLRTRSEEVLPLRRRIAA